MLGGNILAEVALAGSGLIAPPVISSRPFSTIWVPAEGRNIRVSLGQFDMSPECPRGTFPDVCVPIDMTAPTVCWEDGLEYNIQAGSKKQLQMDWTDWLAEFADDAPIISASVTYEGQVTAVQIGLTAYTVSIEVTAPAGAAKGMKTMVSCSITTEGQVECRPFFLTVC